MTWISIIWIFVGLFLLAFAGILTLLIQHIGDAEVVMNFVRGLFFTNESTQAAYNLLFWSAIYALIANMPLTGIYALVVLIVKLMTK